MTTRIHPTLPVFRLDAGGDSVLYTPGYARSTTAALAGQVEAALAGLPGTGPEASALASELAQRGHLAALAWRDLAERPFAPECLTLYLHNHCNLACSYCYAMPADQTQARTRLPREAQDIARLPLLTEPVIQAAARLVAGHCVAKGKPLTLVLHGGGEPTLHWDLMVRAWEATAAIAREKGIPLWSYLATHGVLAEERVRWLAGHFDLVGLSCDGPPEIQNANRPGAAGTGTSSQVERTARVLREEGADFAVRATITPAASERQPEIVEYLCDRLLARTIRFEPAYDGRQAPGRHFRAGDAEAFVASFLAARRAAWRRGCTLELSGVRLEEIHGPFCNPLREVLQLTPDGRASACFLTVGNDAVADEAMAMGWLDPLTGRFEIDRARVAEERRQAARIPVRCEGCHNIYHCARDCPDVCLLSEPRTDEPEAGFRCRVQQLVGRALILELAAARQLAASGS